MSVRWSDWDGEAHDFICEPGVGLTVLEGRWLSWDETVALCEWLGDKIRSFDASNAPLAADRSHEGETG